MAGLYLRRHLAHTARHGRNSNLRWESIYSIKKEHWARKLYNKANPICSGPLPSSDEGGCDIFLPVDWQIHCPFCSPVGGQRGGTCAHTQSVSGYMTSLFHSPHPACKATWKGLREPPQKAQDGLTFRLPGMKIKEARRTKEWPPLVLECMCVAGLAGVSIALADTSACLHAGKSDGLAPEQITCHVRYKWHRTFYTGPFILTEWEQQENSRCFHSAVQGWRVWASCRCELDEWMMNVSIRFFCVLPKYSHLISWILVLE